MSKPFIITDGEAKDDPKPGQVRSLVGRCKDYGVQVNVVHFSAQPRPDSTLLQLAAETGGMHRFINLQMFAGGP